MLAEHGRMARDYTDVRANTVASFALGDYEWMLAFEADELHRIVDLMRHLRASDARRHVREELPFYTGRRRTRSELVTRPPVAVEKVRQAVHQRAGHRRGARGGEHVLEQHRLLVGAGQRHPPVGVLVGGARLVLGAPVADRVGERDAAQPRRGQRQVAVQRRGSRPRPRRLVVRADQPAPAHLGQPRLALRVVGGGLLVHRRVSRPRRSRSLTWSPAR